jgi:hypothetical protein
VWCTLGAAICARERTLPTESELRGLYGESADVRLSGNVVEVLVRQPREHLERGGSLWAQVGPYIYLFTPETREIFQKYDGVAAVRAITRMPGDGEIARATLVRDTLTDYTWQRAFELANEARRHGSERPKALYDLIRWAEQYTDYRYTYR